ncbi:MAG: TonB-dependent receptor [Woeseia sp.]
MKNSTLTISAICQYKFAGYRPLMLAAALATLLSGQQAFAQDDVIEEVVVTGIRGSLQNAVEAKRNSDNLIEAIYAEDIGKLPDQNLAEVLENVTGIQITRTAGVGTGVQIRGTDANRTEINGVSTVGSGSGRSGIDFEDVSAAIIAGVEITKASEARTIEGSVGGTINLKTIRPLQLTEPLLAFRIQGEDSSLSTDSGLQPRLSGTWGNNWTTGHGDIGAVFSASWSEQDVSAFRPRVDRDNFVAAGGNPSAPDFDFLPIQFLVQGYENYEYETVNFAGTLEWAPNDEFTFHLDTVINDQQSRQESSRVQASGVSNLRFATDITEFETVNFGTLDGENGLQNLGSIAAAARGIIPAQTASPWDPNMRLSSDTNSRSTESYIVALGGEWVRDRISVGVEASTSNSDTTTPSINTTLNFINPNVASGTPNENGTPFEFDLTGGSLTFGIAESDPNAPSTAQLLDPANYRLDAVNVSRDIADNRENAFRVDLSYDMVDSSEFLTSIDAGYRFSKTTSTRYEVSSNLGFGNMNDAPPGNLFSSILTAGPNNFNAADGRRLYVPDFLLVDPQQVAANQDAVLSVVNDAILTHQTSTGSTAGGIDSPTSSANGFFDIAEETNALYAQANFESGIFRGNVGLRYLKTDVSSTGNRVLNGVAVPTTTKGSYGFALPRLNLVADVAEDVVIRFGWGQDIRRPNFDDLSTSFTFSTSPNPPVALGNPDLEPEEVTSIDLSVEWYFAPASVVSIGYFHKERTGLFFPTDSDPVEDANGFRDITDPCEGGGIFNPIADPNVFAPPGTPQGVCVPTSQTVNGSGTSTQQGVEIAVQYDLAQFEDRLGWASGFGFIANYTSQSFGGSEEFFSAFSRPTTVFNSLGATEVVTWRGDLLNLSENAYNITAYYEKYGLSARMRYTWREAYRSDDYVGTTSPPWGFPVVNDDRGQLNASASYAVTDNLDIGIEAVNITEEDVTQYCVNENALLCFQGLTDRRITVGASYRF